MTISTLSKTLDNRGFALSYVHPSNKSNFYDCINNLIKLKSFQLFESNEIHSAYDKRKNVKKTDLYA